MPDGPGTTPANLMAGEGPDIAQSHSAVLVFFGERAYKFKKPVDLGFLDFSTVESRERACRRELELNRRLAPDVYLDLAQVLDGDGRVCDWLVVMKRMPAGRRLSELVRRGEEVTADLRRLARVLASFHSEARRGPDVDATAGLSALRKRWFDNFSGIEPFAGNVIDRGSLREVAELVQDYVDGRAPLFADRIDRGCAVDGHGDLRAEDIFCLPDGPRVLDCLEFDDALRFVDVLDDAAFLVMDLERLGSPALAAEFSRAYREFSATPVVRTLEHHYIAYRAFVRAKVACVRRAQGVERAAGEAQQLLGISLEHLRAGLPNLVLVGGLPGTGKTTIAGSLADRLGAVLLRTDVIRGELPELAGLPGDSGYGRGRYDPEKVHQTYRVMLDRARTLLGLGEHVVLDASWSSAAERRAARDLAGATCSRTVELRCAAPPEITEPRITTRADASEATPEIAARMRADFAPWPEATEIDTAGHPESAEQAAWEALSGATGTR
ncbi:AAA family ATPase [Saccharopolyspora griseoalba]|uniref:AAA family ATPase n=1 Tax=Saccharopolyspora griseoalba TaxID=1431848 RepID=A0ABW2LTC4_9PSEU